MRVFRRVVSIIGYVLAAMFLMSWAMMSFVSDVEGIGKAQFMGFMAALTLVPLAAAALISPGRRGREIGIVLLVAAGWTAFSGVTLAVLMMDEKFMALMPPNSAQTLAMFNDLAFGTVFTIAMGAGGFWLAQRKNKAGLAQ